MQSFSLLSSSRSLYSLWLIQSKINNLSFSHTKVNAITAVTALRKQSDKEMHCQVTLFNDHIVIIKKGNRNIYQKDKKNRDNRSKIKLYSHWLKLSDIWELSQNYRIWPCLVSNGHYALAAREIWYEYHDRTKYHDGTCYALYYQCPLKSDCPIRKLKHTRQIAGK